MVLSLKEQLLHTQCKAKEDEAELLQLRMLDRAYRQGQSSQRRDSLERAAVRRGSGNSRGISPPPPPPRDPPRAGASWDREGTTTLSHTAATSHQSTAQAPLPWGATRQSGGVWGNDSPPRARAEPGALAPPVSHGGDYSCEYVSAGHPEFGGTFESRENTPRQPLCTNGVAGGGEPCPYMVIMNESSPVMA